MLYVYMYVYYIVPSGGSESARPPSGVRPRASDDACDYYSCHYCSYYCYCYCYYYYTYNDISFTLFSRTLNSRRPSNTVETYKGTASPPQASSHARCIDIVYTCLYIITYYYIISYHIISIYCIISSCDLFICIAAPGSVERTVLCSARGGPR